MKTLKELDLAGVEFLDFCFLEGRRADVAEKYLAAITYNRTDVARAPKEALARTRRAVKGFVKLAPHRSRIPLSWEWVTGIAVKLLMEKEWEAAVMLLLIFDTYARPSAITRMRTEDLLAPVRATGLQRWALLLSPQERELPTKTGTFDETVVVSGLDVNLSECMRRLKSSRDPQEPLFSIGAAGFKAAFSQAAECLGLGDWKLMGYQARHGGATRDILLQRRTLEEVRKRGHWHTYTSVRRYEKSGRVQKVLADSPSGLLEWCQKVGDALPKLLRGSRAAVPPVPPIAKGPSSSLLARLA